MKIEQVKSINSVLPRNTWGVCCFVGVRGTSRSGSWSVVADSDCYVKDEVIFLFYSKLTLVQFKNVIVSTIMNAKLKD